MKFVILILVYGATKLITAIEQCATYQFSNPFLSGVTCKEIYDWNPQIHKRSGYYWLIDPFGNRSYVDSWPLQISALSVTS